MLKKYVSFVVLIIGFVVAFNTSANANLDRPKVKWGGLSFVDNKKGDVFKYSLKHQKRINEVLTSKLKELNPENFDIVFDDFLNIRKGESLVLTAVIDQEEVFVRHVIGINQVGVYINVSLMVIDFDLNENTLIASFPVSLGDFVESYPGVRPSDKQTAALVEAYIFGGLPELEMSLVDLMVNRLKSVDIKYQYAARISVADILFSKKFESNITGFNEISYSYPKYYADMIARVLSSEQNVSVLPYISKKNHTKLAINFTGVNLTKLIDIPEADYFFKIEFEKFLVKKKPAKIESTEQHTYGVRAKVDLIDSFGDVIFSESLIDTMSGHFPEGSQSAELSNINLVLEGLAKYVFAEKRTKNYHRWVKKQGKKYKEILKELDKVSEVLEECRA